MARRDDFKIIAVDLKKVVERDKLKPRESKEPYWQSLSSGCYLGFRPSTRPDGLGTWLARFNDEVTGKTPKKSLGDYGTLPASARYDAAKKAAEDWFRHLSHGGVAKDITVREACERYTAKKSNAAQWFARHVYDDPIANIMLRKLAKGHVQDWRGRLEARPAQVSRRKDGEIVTRPRAAKTVARDIAPFRAALNAAHDDGFVESKNAWAVVLRTPKIKGGRRDVYLDRQQRRDLLDALPNDARAFARGLCLLPLRPGALAALYRSHFDARRRLLTIGKDKSGEDRTILLPPETVAFFSEQAKDKLPGAPLFVRADGKAWNKDTWKHPIADAARAAGLPEKTTAYTLRHSTITDLVTGGLDLLTVAQVSGTSVAMIEEHYGHLRKEHAAVALAGLVL